MPRLLSLMMLLPLCDGFVGIDHPMNNKKSNPLCFSKRPKVADASDEWPTDLPSWGSRDWMTPTDNTHSQNNKLSVTNDFRTWELVLAKALPHGSVSPASATLAPKGGCDNLCDDEERYSDTCDFTVSGQAEWLLVRTEDRQWSFKVGPEGTLSPPP